MRLDVRIPAGLMFAMIGALLTGYGALGDQAIYARSLGININLIWGVVMLAGAAGLLLLSYKRRGGQDDRTAGKARREN